MRTMRSTDDDGIVTVTDPMPPDGFHRRIAAETVDHLLCDGCLDSDIPGIRFTTDEYGVVHVSVMRLRKSTDLGSFNPGDWLNDGDAVASDGSVWCAQCTNSNAIDCRHRVPAAAWCAEMILRSIVGSMVDTIYDLPA